MAELFLLLTGVQALEATIRSDPREMIGRIGKSVWQGLLVVLLEAVRRRVLRMRRVRPIRVLQGVEAVARWRQRGAGPLEGLELQERAGSGRG